jgi:acyl-CoA reductase-like NAD-dependent aldehyde dehydrogenase
MRFADRVRPGHEGPPCGLAATVLTRSMSHTRQAWRDLPVSTIKINTVCFGRCRTSRRGSSQGFGYGPELLDEMTAIRAVHLEALPPGHRRYGSGPSWRIVQLASAFAA